MHFACILLICATSTVMSHRDPKHCEVCIKTLEKYIEFAKSKQIDPYNESKFEHTFKELCKNLTDKEERFCYYLGGLSTSATSLLNHISRPMGFQKPVKLICEQDVNRVDQHVCELRYDLKVDLSTIDIDKLTLRELRKILSDWGEVCVGCTEKSEFVKLVKDLMPSKLGKRDKQEL